MAGRNTGGTPVARYYTAVSNNRAEEQVYLPLSNEKKEKGVRKKEKSTSVGDGGDSRDRPGAGANAGAEARSRLHRHDTRRF